MNIVLKRISEIVIPRKRGSIYSIMQHTVIKRFSQNVCILDSCLRRNDSEEYLRACNLQQTFQTEEIEIIFYNYCPYMKVLIKLIFGL